MAVLHDVLVAPKLKWDVFEVVAIISSALGYEYLIIRFALWATGRGQFDSQMQSLPVDGIEEEKRSSELEDSVNRSMEADALP